MPRSNAGAIQLLCFTIILGLFTLVSLWKLDVNKYCNTDETSLGTLPLFHHDSTSMELTSHSYSNTQVSPLTRNRNHSIQTGALKDTLASNVSLQALNVSRKNLTTIPNNPTKPIPVHQTIKPSIWMDVDEFSEGMATWRISLAEVLMVAKELDAILVEPCIRDGRLRTCRDSTYTLSQMYDLASLQRFHPRIVPFSDYQHELKMLRSTQPQNSMKQISMCLQRPFGTPSVSKVCGNRTNTYQVRVNEHIHRATVLQSKNITTILKIRYYRQGGFLISRITPNYALDATLVNDVLTKYFSFIPHHYDTVNKLLNLFGISSDASFDVIHWRSEIFNTSHAECANRIIQARKKMHSNQTILISSIQQDTDIQWARSDRRDEAIASIDRLATVGFRKLDQLFDSRQNQTSPAMAMLHEAKHADKVVFSIWDQIISQKARRFATCTKSCKLPKANPHPCVSCNFLGNFAEMAMSLRQQHGKSSDECWPT